MDISIKHGTPAKHKSACFVAPVYSGKSLGDCATALDKSLRGGLSKLLKRGDITGKAGESLMVPLTSGVEAERILLVGVGKRSGVSAAQFTKIADKAAAMAVGAGFKNAISALSEISVDDRDDAWKLTQQVAAFEGKSYRFDEFKTLPKRKPARFSRLTIYLNTAPSVEIESELAVAQASVNGLRLTKDLANTPANFCTPQHLADKARALGKEFKSLRIDVLSEAAMEKLGMGSLLSVSRGSEQPAKLITMEYKGGKAGDKPIVLVGKGVTFDSGGISLKPGAAMDEMKYDMCGAATVFGVMETLARSELAVNVVGVVPATENLPDGKATKPGDVVTSMSGQTIEILNTDAEGRLILCDALTYSAKFDPDVVIDIATLTGACIIALGHNTTALMSNDDELADDLFAAGQLSGDKAWRLPLDDEYQQLIDSPFADMANVGGRAAGSITAACFLARYTKEYRWAHLDIAGTAWRSGKPKGATGRPVNLLMTYIRQRLQAPND